MKKIIVLIFFITILFSFVSCSMSPSAVMLSSRWTMRDWCKERYGDCIYKEADRGKNCVSYTFEDSEKHFLYHASSYAEGLDIDGSNFGYYESKRSDFDSEYKKLFFEQNKDILSSIKNKYDCSFDAEKYFPHITIVGTNQNETINCAKDITDCVLSFDQRKFWGKDFNISLYINKERIGYYSYDGFLSKDNAIAKWLLERAAQEMKISVEDLVFINLEIKNVEDIPGYERDNLVCILGSDNDTKTNAEVCYFSYNGEEYFIANLQMYYDDHATYRCLGNYPTKKY